MFGDSLRTSRTGSACAVAALAVVAAAGAAAAQNITLVQFTGTSLTRPVDIANAAGDSRLFVVEKPGRIRVVQSDGTVLGTPFLDITALVNDGGNEQGLLGLAFHPNYASNGFFYVNYTDNAGDTVVARYTVSGNPNIADADSAVPIITIAQPFSNHNGGDLNFGPADGYLYIGMGDGGSACDPNGHAQDPQELLGKILRIDVDSGSPYAIPPSNPFAGSLTTREEIWATGLRNPWRFTFDYLGNLFVADVGQGSLEEIDFQPATSTGGENYGWRCYEGTDFNPCGDPCTPVPNTLPIHEYTHGGSPFRCSVTGGLVHRGLTYPALEGHYFFADYCSGDFWSLTTEDSGMTWDLHTFGQPIADFNATTFGEDSDGDLFVADDGTGLVYRIEPAAEPPDCPPSPAVGCTGPAKSILKVKRPGDDTTGRLLWKWLYGTSFIDVGDPVGGNTAYRLCVYNGAGIPVIDVALPGPNGWQQTGTGYKYKNPQTAPDGGAFKAIFRNDDLSKLIVKGKGINLDLDALPLNEVSQLTAQLIRSDSSACWEAVYPAASIIADDSTQLKAKIP
jgi:glucose/arabinose dehydrogenase